VTKFETYSVCINDSVMKAILTGVISDRTMAHPRVANGGSH